MYFHDELMKARQEDLLRRAARDRLAATARHSRPVRRQGHAVSRRSRLLAAWAGAKPVVSFVRVSRPEGEAR